ncbi:hypothetical protein M427DRAFT_72992 [Gonapodya prolifera JEL478]|uniref:Actin cytoskeleton-regulatory complex protein SLA1 n=1 Tax=Gonapodya prolifera (strain JEL478) TaxID=1344416 RepID=A0A139A4G8_GONPJ|nr:hypothetical protein M427DRAFT_72992 [Gonapodya prolifera JEL478]|eukprot:KXS11375.1 hypothetical protein M427DRAFT_72992 [Gonapodya prolifera JEL478]
MGYESAARVVYDYDPQGDEELGVREGKVVLVESKSDDGWWRCKDVETGQSGLIPGSYVEDLVPSQHDATAASFDYTANDADELTFAEGDSLIVLDRSDPDWWICSLNGTIGLAPTSYLVGAADAANDTYDDAAQEDQADSAPAADYASSPRADPTQLQSRFGDEPDVDAPNDISYWSVQELDPKKKKKVRDGLLGASDVSVWFVSESKLTVYFKWALADLSKRERKGKRVHLHFGGGEERIFELKDKKDAEKLLAKVEEMARLKKTVSSLAPAQPRPALPPHAIPASMPSPPSSAGPKIAPPVLGPSPAARAAGLAPSPPPVVAPPSPPAPAPNAPKLATALYAYTPDASTSAPDEISVRENDILVVLDGTTDAGHGPDDDPDWIRVRLVAKDGRGGEGVVPRTYVEVKRSGAGGADESPNPGYGGAPAGLAGLAAAAAARRPASPDGGAAPALPRRGTDEGMGSPISAAGSPSVGGTKSLPDNAKVRTWTDKSGTFKVDAEYLSFGEGKVHLHKTNGVKIAVPLEKLCPADQDFVRSINPGAAHSRPSSPGPKLPARTASLPVPDRPSLPTRDGGAASGSFVYNGFDWYEFLTNKAAIAPSDAKMYAATFVREKIDAFTLNGLDVDILKSMGVASGDIIRVRKAAEKAGEGDKPKSSLESLALGPLPALGDAHGRREREAAERNLAKLGLEPGANIQLKNDEEIARRLQEDEYRAVGQVPPASILHPKSESPDPYAALRGSSKPALAFAAKQGAVPRRSSGTTKVPATIDAAFVREAQQKLSASTSPAVSPALPRRPASSNAVVGSPASPATNFPVNDWETPLHATTAPTNGAIRKTASQASIPQATTSVAAMTPGSSAFPPADDFTNTRVLSSSHGSLGTPPPSSPGAARKRPEPGVKADLSIPSAAIMASAARSSSVPPTQPARTAIPPAAATPPPKQPLIPAPALRPAMLHGPSQSFPRPAPIQAAPPPPAPPPPMPAMPPAPSGPPPSFRPTLVSSQGPSAPAAPQSFQPSLVQGVGAVSAPAPTSGFPSSFGSSAPAPPEPPKMNIAPPLPQQQFPGGGISQTSLPPSGMSPYVLPQAASPVPSSISSVATWQQQPPSSSFSTPPSSQQFGVGSTMMNQQVGPQMGGTGFQPQFQQPGGSFMPTQSLGPPPPPPSLATKPSAGPLPAPLIPTSSTSFPPRPVGQQSMMGQGGGVMGNMGGSMGGGMNPGMGGMNPGMNGMNMGMGGMNTSMGGMNSNMGGMGQSPIGTPGGGTPGMATPVMGGGMNQQGMGMNAGNMNIGAGLGGQMQGGLGNMGGVGQVGMGSMQPQPTLGGSLLTSGPGSILGTQSTNRGIQSQPLTPAVASGFGNLAAGIAGGSSMPASAPSLGAPKTFLPLPPTSGGMGGNSMGGMSPSLGGSMGPGSFGMQGGMQNGIQGGMQNGMQGGMQGGMQNGMQSVLQGSMHGGFGTSGQMGMGGMQGMQQQGQQGMGGAMPGMGMGMGSGMMSNMQGMGGMQGMQGGFMGQNQQQGALGLTGMGYRR